MKAGLLAAALLFLSCAKPEQGTLKTVAITAKEASGLEHVPGSPLYWIIEDAGNTNTLYGIDIEGTQMAEITVDTKNVDWESLAADKQGNIYVGDFGNNGNDRTDLAIYRIGNEFVNSEAGKITAVTTFSYPEQKEFPPSKEARFYDCEAFLEHEGNFYLFTKNRSKGFDGAFNVYTIPNREGNFEAKLIGTLSTCNENTCRITGADISTDGKRIAILTEGSIFILQGFSKDNFSDVKIERLSFEDNTQKEGICFTGDHTVMVVDEKNKQGGGNMYHISLSELRKQN